MTGGAMTVYGVFGCSPGGTAAGTCSPGSPSDSMMRTYPALLVQAAIAFWKT
jgi:hypothetical protein